jgi:hypothetical protein
MILWVKFRASCGVLNQKKFNKQREREQAALSPPAPSPPLGPYRVKKLDVP